MARYLLLPVVLLYAAMAALALLLLAIIWLGYFIAGFVAGAVSEIISMWCWEIHRRQGAWVYFVNSRTGQRKAVKAAGHSPLDWRWLRSGDILVDDQGRHKLV